MRIRDALFLVVIGSALLAGMWLAGCSTFTSPTTPSARFSVIETINGYCEPMWFNDGLPWDAKQLIIECVNDKAPMPIYLTGTSETASPLSNLAGPIGSAVTPMIPIAPIP